MGACIAMGLAISLIMPFKYAATAQLEINPENAAALDVPTGPAAPDAEYAVNLATQAAVLQSDTLALQVIEQLKLEEVESKRSFFQLGPAARSLPLEQSPTRRGRVLKRFHRNLTVRVIGGTRLIEISYRDRDPALAAAVANQLVNDYLDTYFQTRYNATRQASDWLSKQLAELKNDAEASQQRLTDYQRRAGILGESETNNVVMAKLEELNKQLSAAEANRIVKQAVWHLAKTGDPELISSVAGTSFVQGVTTPQAQLGLLPTLRAQEAQLKAEIAQTAARTGPNFPKLVQMKTQLGDMQASIAAEVAKIAARAENDYVAAKHAEDMERGLFEQQKQEANKLNDAAVQYGILKREVDASRDLYQGLLGKLKQASVLAGLRSSNIVVIDPARAPAKPSSPNYLLNLALGIALGIVGGIGAALVQDGIDPLVHSPKAVTGMLLAVTPIRNGTEHEIAERESIRALRTRLTAGKARVFLIASALPGEGKTTIASQLARSLAGMNRRVLLVDADLHRPSLQREFDLPSNGPSLGQLLTNPQKMPGIPANQPDNLHVLAASGETDPELLASPRLTELIAEWRSNFDYVLFDTPPILAFPDALIVAPHMDSIVVVARAGQTTKESLLRATEMFSETAVAGIVLNGLDFDSPHYAQYYGHRYCGGNHSQ